MTRDISQASVHKDKVRPASAVSRWSMDSSDVSDGKILDSWGGNDGTLNGGVTTGVSGVGSSEAFNFDGSDDYVDTAERLTNSAPLTVSAWINSNVKGNVVFSNHEWSGCHGQRKGYGLYTDASTGAIYLWAGGSGNYSRNKYASSNVCDGNWHHVVASVDRDERVVYYVDGSQDGSGNLNNTIDPTQERNPALGISSTTCKGRYWEGKIDEVRIYSEALSQQQIWKLYNIGRNANWGFSRS